MNAKQILILSYIYRYHRIDYQELQEELHMPMEDIAALVMELYRQEYIGYGSGERKRNSLQVTEKAEQKYIRDWDRWTAKGKEKKDREEGEEFPVNILHVPKSFDKM
ncbi:MAG TPA: hypothetical protein DCZ40_10670 [Lachnospiraceae bacterium]|nr:hypothetical protein [Lachnospiraceae bacterium]